jgi:hypothetical protein
MLHILLAATATLVMSSGAFAAGTCWMTKAGGIGINKDIATFMSNKALHDMQAKNGEKGVGKVTTTCEVGMIVNCISAQKSCR